MIDLFDNKRELKFAYIRLYNFKGEENGNALFIMVQLKPR